MLSGLFLERKGVPFGFFAIVDGHLISTGLGGWHLHVRTLSMLPPVMPVLLITELTFSHVLDGHLIFLANF